MEKLHPPCFNTCGFVKVDDQTSYMQRRLLGATPAVYTNSTFPAQSYSKFQNFSLTPHSSPSEVAERTETNKQIERRKKTMKKQKKIEYELKATEKEEDINQTNKISLYLSSN